MATRLSILRMLGIVCGLTLAQSLGGCSSVMPSGSKVAFSNVSDTWLNVRFFVSNTEAATVDGTSFVSDERIQVRPGSTVEYALSGNPNYTEKGRSVVHVQVMPVAPSWEQHAEAYWLELLTHPPVTIIATGTANALAFDTGGGSVAVIPDREIKQGRYQHQMVVAPEISTPE